MAFVKPKKHLGQHFLTEPAIAERIASSLTMHGNYSYVLEIGPGKGILTKYLLGNKSFTTYAIEIDNESYDFLISNFKDLENRLISGDFLKTELNDITKENFAVIGNFPYNISSQILVKVIENRDKIPELVGMFQRELARRIVSAPGTREYGILSVLTQAWYKTEYLFTVNEGVFFPPPKVKSGVIRLQRLENNTLGCDEKLFIRIVKAAFNQRRKTLKNALSSFNFEITAETAVLNTLLSKRAEQLNVADFVLLTNAAK